MNENKIFEWILVEAHDVPREVRESALRLLLGNKEKYVQFAGFDIPLNLLRQIEPLGKIPRIKALRDAFTGMGLRDAKDCVEHYFATTYSDEGYEIRGAGKLLNI